jgi:hypothetical protein
MARMMNVQLSQKMNAFSHAGIGFSSWTITPMRAPE